MYPVTLLLSTIAVIEGFVGVLQLVQMVATKVTLGRIQPMIQHVLQPWVGEDTPAKKAMRESFFTTMAHGVMRAIGEKAGSVKGVVSRQMMSEIPELGAMQGIGDVITEILPKKAKGFA